MPELPPNLPNDPLDELLAQARWESPRVGAVERLARRWESLRRPVYRRMLMPLALAACVVLGFSLAWHWVAHPAAAPVARLQPKDEPPPLVRPPTVLERLRFAAVKPLPVEPKPEAVDPALGQLLGQLAAPRMEDRLAAARALAHLEDPRVTGQLEEMVRRKQSVREALAILQARRDPAAEAFVASARGNRKLGFLMDAVQAQYPDL